MTKRGLTLSVAALVVAIPALAQSSTLDRGVELYEAEKYDEALPLLEQAAESGPDRERAIYLAGRAYFEKEEFKEASRWFEKARKIDPSNGEYHSWLGRSYGSWAREANMFRKMSLAGDIHRSFQKAVELDPDDLEQRIDLMTFYLEAPGVVGGSKKKALEQAEAIAELDPARGQSAFGWVYEKGKEYDKAEAAYRKAIDLSPEASGPYYRLAYLHQRQEEFDEALELFLALKEKKPDELGIYYQIGRNGALSGTNLEPSVAALKHYIDEYEEDPSIPSLAWAYTRLGQVYVHQDRKEPARDAFRSALRIDPKHKEAKKGLNKVD